jgi:hypothetical protein
LLDPWGRAQSFEDLDYAEATPTALADAVTAALASPIDYRSVPSGSASRAAALLADLL